MTEPREQRPSAGHYLLVFSVCVALWLLLGSSLESEVYSWSP